MVVDKGAIIALLQEHEAIRASFKWLATSLDSMVPHSEQNECTPEELTRLREAAKNLLDLLNNLHHGFKDHLLRDQQALQPLADTISLDEVDKEHLQIQEELANAVTQIGLALQEKWHREEFLRFLIKTRESVHQISEMVNEHTIEEDNVIKKGLDGIT